MKLINGWTMEEVKDRINKFVPEHGCRENTICKYENGQGQRCVVGSFFTDQYAKKLGSYEGSVEEVWEDFPYVRKMLPFELEDLGKLQSIHDEYAGEDNCGDMSAKQRLLRAIEK